MATASPEPRAELLPSTLAHTAPMPWVEARRRLGGGDWYSWLSTEHPSGRPHTRPVLAVWLDDTLYFVANAGSRKARNLVRTPACSVALATSDAHLVVEGTAAIQRDARLLRRVADLYLSKYDWHVEIQAGAFHGEGAPTAGPSPYDVYALRPTYIYGFGVSESWSPTRWRFG